MSDKLKKMKWRRGTFERNLTEKARASGEPDHVDGWISEPFGIYKECGSEVRLTHLPTGAQISTKERAIAGAKGFAERLMAAAGDHDWNGPKGANPKVAVPTKGAWFRRGEKIYKKVYAGEA